MSPLHGVLGAELVRPRRPNEVGRHAPYVPTRPAPPADLADTMATTGVHGGVSRIPRTLQKHVKLHARVGGHVPACWGVGGMRYRVQLCELRNPALERTSNSDTKCPI